MKKKHNKRLIFSRFTVIALSIILQAVAIWIGIWIGLNKLGSYRHWIWIATYVIGGILLVSLINKETAAVYKLPWIILCLIFPYAGAMCYLTFGNVHLSHRMRKKFSAVYHEKDDGYYEQERIVKNLYKDEPQFAGTFKYLRGVTSLPVYDDYDIEYLPSGERYFEELKKALSSAEKYIFIEYFIVQEGVMWDAVHKILLDKVKNGVKVYLVYDDVGSVTKVASGFYRKLRKEGIDARKFNKFIPVVSIIHNNRDHRKIVVVDGKIAFTGGVNIADEYINVTHPYGRWLDSGVMIKGKPVDSFVRIFTQIFNVSGKPIDENDFICRDHEKFLSNGYCMPFGDSPAPITAEHISETTFLNAIYGAREYIYFACPYLVADTDIRGALANAARRGVDVRLIIPQKPDKKTIYIMTKFYCSLLKKSGVKIYLYRDGFVHSKTMICDGKLAFAGTVNLDYRSFVHHFECGIIFTDEKAVGQVKDDFDNLFNAECTPADDKSLKLNVLEKAGKIIMDPFAPLF